MKLLLEGIAKFVCGAALVGLMFVAGFVVAGLDHRFDWSDVPGWVVIAASVLFLMFPLVLGSWYALIPFALYPAIMIVRLRDEEALLSRELRATRPISGR